MMTHRLLTISHFPNIRTPCPDAPCIVTRLEYTVCFVPSCLCLVVPAWNALCWLACLIKLFSFLQIQLTSTSLGKPPRERLPTPSCCVHPPCAPTVPGAHACSVPAPSLWWFVSSNRNVRAGTFCLPFCSTPSMVAGTEHAVNVIIGDL